MSEDQFTKLFKYMEKRFDSVDQRFDLVDEKLSRLQSTVDAYAKKPIRTFWKWQRWTSSFSASRNI